VEGGRKTPVILTADDETVLEGEEETGDAREDATARQNRGWMGLECCFKNGRVVLPSSACFVHIAS
jgi:hypothetical protein